MKADGFSQWATLELMGHRTRAGLVEEVEMAGTKMLRVDIPVSETDMVTEFYGGQAVYSICPTSEAVIRQQMSRDGRDPRPVRPLDYRPAEDPAKALAPPLAADDDGEYGDEEGDGDDIVF